VRISAPPDRGAVLLSTSALSAGYGALRVLEPLDLRIHEREIVALVGPNGAGKSTLLRALSGLIPKTGGDVVFAGTDITRSSPEACGRLGLVHVIEGHRVFPSLTVEDNLLLATLGQPASRRARVDEAYAAFPELAQKRHLRAGSLSGGQQQMLVIGQGIARRPRLLLLDEPSAGLAPVLIDRVLDVVAALRAGGTAVLLVEQAVEKALRVADHVYALVHGCIVLDTDAPSAQVPGVLERAYLGVSRSARPSPVDT
jgi:branched-chain amino acid transport system ATP-binding protein